MECKLRCVNFRRVSDTRREFRPAFTVTGIPDDWYRRAMGVIVICLRTPWSAGENFGCTWEHLGALATSLGAPVTGLGASKTSLGAWMSSLGARMTSLGAPGSASNKPRSPTNHSEAVWENEIFFGNGAGAPRNHSYYLSFNDF